MQELYLGNKYSHSDTSNAAVWIDLEDDAQAVKINEYIAQTAYSFEIETNALGTLFGIRGIATTTDMIDVLSVVTTANVLDLSAAALTTGKVIDISDLAAITTGKAIHVDATGVTHTSGILVHIDSAATAMTGAGRLLLVDHTGATSTSGIVAEIATAATDETTLLTLTSAAATGVSLDINGASTSGNTVTIDGTAFTTGSALVVTDNSADTGTRSVLKIVQDHASATGATALEVQQDGDSYAIKISGATTKGIDLTAIGAGEPAINFTDGSASSIDPSMTAESGWLNIAVGGVVKYVPYYAAS